MSEYDLVLDHLISTHPDKFEQAKTQPSAVCWFVGRTMQELDGHGVPQKIADELARKLECK